MLLSFLFVLISTELASLGSKDVNINKLCSENKVASTNIPNGKEHPRNFDDSLTDTDSFVQNGGSNVENVSSEMVKDSLLLDHSKDDSCTPGRVNNKDFLETNANQFAISTMETTAMSIAQATEEKSISEELKKSDIINVICADSSTFTNSSVNADKMDEIQSNSADIDGEFSENLSQVITQSITHIVKTDQIQLKRDTNKDILNKNSNYFTKESDFRVEKDNNKSTEEVTNIKKDDCHEIDSLSQRANEFKTIPGYGITYKEGNVKKVNENKVFTMKHEVDVLEINTTTNFVQNSQTMEDKDNKNEVISEAINCRENREEETSMHDQNELKLPSLINGEEGNKENYKTNVPKNVLKEMSLNKTTLSNVVRDKPKFAALKDDQLRPIRRTDKQIAESKLEFPDVPEGESFHIQELGLSEGIFVFSYLSSFLSWIQPYDFPVELLRDALWSRVSVVELITQSLQVEVGFIVCLTVGILLALGVPCMLIAHACCRLLNSNKRDSGWNEDSASETTNNCAVNFRRCTLVFVVQLILLLLLAGIVSMFVTNEQMSRAVDQTPRVVHTALSDVTTFLRNSHQQLQFVITKSLDQAVDAAYTDLDNVEELLGRPIQAELAEETGVDVALDALVDVSTAARTMSGKVEDFLTSCMEAREMVMESREQLADLRMQVDMFRQQCPARLRPLCNTVNASGLDVVLRLDTVMSDDRLLQIRDLRDGNLSLVTQQARGEFQYIPLRVEKDTRDARNGVKRQLNRQKEVLDSSIWSLDVVTRDLTYKIENARNQALQIVQSVSAIEQWRWLTGLGAALSVLLLWVLLLSGITCGCCGAEQRAAPTLLASVVLMCLFSIILWTVALCALLVGGHGEVFICRPLYDEPEYSALTRLVDRPGVLFQRGGGFFSNLLYGNSTMDVPLKDVLQKCQGNGSTYSAFKLKQVFDVDSASNHRQWDLLHSELSRLQVNLSNMLLLTPELQHQLQDLLHATTVNITNFRAQMAGQVTGKDLTSFADQMSSVANQIADWATLNRLENLISMTRNIMAGHIQPLEQHKEDLVYQLTGLEMQLAPLQRQVNQSLSHLKTIQYYINNQGDNIAYQKSQVYVNRLISYMDQYRDHVLNKTQHHVAPCRPVWNLYHAMRLLLCRHVMDPLNGFWFATVWCLLLFLASTPLCLKLIDHYKHLKHSSGLLRSRSSESPSETLMIPEQSAPWSTPGAPENDGW